MDEEEEYFCLKCMKYHSINYNTHKRFALDVEKIHKMYDLLLEFGDKLDNLEKRIDKIEKTLDRWDVHMARKSRNYLKHWREL